MPPGPVQAATLTSKYVSVTAEPLETEKLLIQIIVGEGWLSHEEAAERSEDWLARFRRRLSFLIEEARGRGYFITFAFSSSGTDFIQGSCYNEPHEGPEVIEAKRRRANTLQIVDRCKALLPEEFETLSGKVLSLLKVEEPYVSRRSADQGIDFFGKVAFGNLVSPTVLDPGGEKHFYVWLAGQSKHYPETSVSTSEIRELVGSVALAKNNVFAGKIDPLDRFDLRVCDPVFYLFFTTGRFTRDSQQVLERAGVMALNGIQIGQFLADHGVGIHDGIFEPDLFDVWLNAEE